MGLVDDEVDVEEKSSQVMLLHHAELRRQSGSDVPREEGFADRALNWDTG